MLVKKSTVQHVKAHLREGKRVAAHTRIGKKKTGLTANYRQMHAINEAIEANMPFIIHMGKEIARSHGLDISYQGGKPVGDLADLISEGKHGMLIGGMESIKDKKTAEQKLIQMKNRAKQRMRGIAKQFMGAVKLPRDVIKHLAIIAAAKEKYADTNEGLMPGAEDLADMIVLHKRTREGGKKKLNIKETIARIEELDRYRGTQSIQDVEIKAEEKDLIASQEEADTRALVHRILADMVKRDQLSKEQQAVLFLRFYVDEPEQTKNTRSFEDIAKLFNEGIGKVSSKVGDTYRFTPKKRIPVITKRNVGGKIKRVMSYRYEPYKQAVTGVIVKINPDSFVVKQRGKAKQYTVKGQPPSKDYRTNAMQIFRLYQTGVATILSHHEASKKLKQALSGMQKSVMMVPRKLKIGSP